MNQFLRQLERVRDGFVCFVLVVGLLLCVGTMLAGAGVAYVLGGKGATTDLLDVLDVLDKDAHGGTDGA